MMEKLKEKVTELIKKIIIEIGKYTNEEQEFVIDDNQDLVTVGMDSLSFIKLLVQIEIEFEIEFEDEELLMENFQTVNTIVSLLGEKIENE